MGPYRLSRIFSYALAFRRFYEVGCSTLSRGQPPYPTATRLVSIPQEKTIAEGSDLILTVQAEGQVPVQGFIHLRSQGSESWRKIELLREDPRNFPYSMNNVDESFEYFFEIGDASPTAWRIPES